MSEFTEPKRQRKSHVSLSAVSVESDSKKLSPPPALVSTHLPRKTSTYVYVNNAYDGRLSSVSDMRNEVSVQLPPPTSVVREQYWACSRWPRAQRILAITVGVLVGSIVGLTIMVIIRGSSNGSIIDELLRTRNAPD